MTLSKIAGQALDLITELMGRIGTLLILYCMVFGLTDVFLRYVMNAPSLWIGTTIQAALVLIACMAGAYAYKHGDFIKLDLFYAHFSPRTKAIFDSLTAIFSFMFLGVLIWKGTQAALISIKLSQVTPTAVAIPIYPIKSVIPISAAIVLLLVMRQFYRDIKVAFNIKTD